MLDTMKNAEHLASADALPDSSLDSFERCLTGWNQLAVERRMRGQEPAAALAVAACTVLPVQDMRIGVAYFRERADILSRLEHARADVARLQAELESHLSQERCVIAAELRRLAEQFELGVNDILGEAPAPRVPNAQHNSDDVVATPTCTRARMYRGTQGEVWLGRGRYPRWLKQALADGHVLDEFAV